jgi:Lon protease-like protein
MSLLPTNIPIFPLPNVVFFPGTLLPLHIFESRYREMVVDALEGERMIGMALLKPGWEGKYLESPDVYSIGCVGEILHHEKIGNGKFNITLSGKSKVRIEKFIQERPYRIAKVEHLQDATIWIENDQFNKDVENLFILFDKLQEASDLSLQDKILQKKPESIINTIAMSLEISILEKQKLLEIEGLKKRYKKVKIYLEEAAITQQALDHFRPLVSEDILKN